MRQHQRRNCRLSVFLPLPLTDGVSVLSEALGRRKQGSEGFRPTGRSGTGIGPERPEQPSSSGVSSTEDDVFPRDVPGEENVASGKQPGGSRGETKVSEVSKGIFFVDRNRTGAETKKALGVSQRP